MAMLTAFMGGLVEVLRFLVGFATICGTCFVLGASLCAGWHWCRCRKKKKEAV